MPCTEIQKRSFFLINSIYTMCRDNTFMYGKYRDLRKMLIFELILYMPYIDKVSFIHAMYRDSKTITFS